MLNVFRLQEKLKIHCQDGKADILSELTDKFLALPVFELGENGKVWYVCVLYHVQCNKLFELQLLICYVYHTALVYCCASFPDFTSCIRIVCFAFRRPRTGQCCHCCCSFLILRCIVTMSLEQKRSTKVRLKQ